MGARFDRERVRESMLRAATVYIERYEVRDDSAGTVEDHGHDFDGADQDFNERVDAVKALVKNTKGIFARVAADITSADANIVHIAMDEDLTHESTVLRFVIQVSDRVHLANIMRKIRVMPDVIKVTRNRN